MEKRGNSEHVRIEKKKSNEADEVPASALVELRSLGKKGHEDRWIDFEVEHGDVAPRGSQKYSRHLRKSIRTLPPISPQATGLLETSSLSFRRSRRQLPSPRWRCPPCLSCNASRGCTCGPPP